MGVSSGAVDMAMTVVNAIKARWWMAGLSLQMGAWVRVREWQGCGPGRVLCAFRGSRKALLSSAKRFGCLKEYGRERALMRESIEEFAVRLPGQLLACGCIVAFIYMSEEWHHHGKCFNRWLHEACLWGFGLFFLSLHLAFIPGFSSLLRSPFMRHILMIMRYFNKSWEVPEYLYLLDGGLIDCMGVYDLLRRKERWIISLDAASPPTDPCRFIRVIVQLALDERMCSFSDPTRPGRDVQYALDDYARDSSKVVLHLKILYEPDSAGEEATTGDIFFVSMRVPDDEQELQRGRLCPTSFSEAPPAQQRIGTVSCVKQKDHGPFRRDLHGVCCCDVCHDKVPLACQRPCGRFPNISMTNQFLTPRLFTELCHLGREMGGKAIDCMDREMQLCAQRL